MNLSCPYSQLVCNAIRKMCAAYKALKLKKSKAVPAIRFRGNSQGNCMKK